uniref:Uncharacterized protein n=1 Tax=Mycena chlorophos TaxID=658473 RepID=A0ABQ0L2Y0_MYCCL|nr:predicted protein [Mycena chlorophos]
MLPPTLLSLTFSLLLHLTHLPRLVSADVQPFTIYDNVFIPPDYIAARNFSPALGGSQETIRQWANLTVETAPWTVTSKPIVAPSGDKKDYMSWAP